MMVAVSLVLVVVASVLLALAVIELFGEEQ